MFVCIGFACLYIYEIYTKAIWIHGIWAKQKDMSSFSARDGICWVYVKSEQKGKYMMLYDARTYDHIRSYIILESFLLLFRRFFYLFCILNTIFSVI